MAADNWQKLKIYKLAELLQQETDEDHPLKTAEICSKLEAMGIPCDRRTLATDIDLLNEEGLEVQWRWIGRSKAFYVEDRSFSEADGYSVKETSLFRDNGNQGSGHRKSP